MDKTPITLDALRALDAIDRKGSFAAAATELFKVPSAITYAVRTLERDLKVELFDRSGPRPALTPVGRMVLEEGRKLLAGAERLTEAARQLDRGWETQINIALDTAIPLRALHSVLRRFESMEVDVSVRILGESLSGCWDALIDERADLAIGAVADICPPGRFVTATLGNVDHWMVARPGHPITAASEPVSRKELQLHCIVVVADSARNLPHRSLGMTVGGRNLVVATMQQKYEAIVAGIGIGHLPVFWARDAVARGDLAVVETADQPPTVESLIAWHRGRAGRAVRWFAKESVGVLANAEVGFASKLAPTGERAAVGRNQLADES